jgi:two-component system cell cycle sensor histidine kinase/response regulator CckA
VTTSGREAVASFREDPGKFCAVLLDLTMPEMSGADTFAELRRLDPAVKVVLMSGFTEQDAVARFHKNDLAGFVSKPFAPEELRDRFQALFPDSAADAQRANGSTAIGSPQ